MIYKRIDCISNSIIATSGLVPRTVRPRGAIELRPYQDREIAVCFSSFFSLPLSLSLSLFLSILTYPETPLLGYTKRLCSLYSKGTHILSPWKLSHVWLRDSPSISRQMTTIRYLRSRALLENFSEWQQEGGMGSRGLLDFFLVYYARSVSLRACPSNR